MNDKSNPKLTGVSKSLRTNMTKEEKHLWYDFLKKLPYTVNRQKVIGEYVVDFYCASAALVIEVDGVQHYEEAVRKADSVRDDFLNGLGITVLRYTNGEINRNFQGVCTDILKCMGLGTDKMPWIE